MKKIISVAVAAAFAGPVLAADVTLSGDVEYKFEKFEGDGVSSAIGDQDIKVAATEEVNGMTVGAYIEVNNGAGAGAASLSGSFGTFKIGSDVDHAINAVDEAAVVAEAGLGAATPGVGGTDDIVIASYTLPTLVDGLTVIASFGASAGTDNTDSGDDSQNTSIAASYSVGGLGLAIGTSSGDDQAASETTYTSVSYSTGPFFVAYDMTNNDGGVVDADNSAIGLTYNYGSGKVYYEGQTEETASASTDNNAIGVSYKIGSMNTYVESISGDTDTGKGTIVGVEYAF